MRAHASLRLIKASLFAAAAAAALAVPASADFIKQTNLITDDQGVNPAQITDANLLNPWGLAASATSPLWVSDNGAGVATVYRINPATNATTKLGLTVTIPGDGSVNGQVFNTGAAAGAFNGDNFLFTSEDGTISGWRGALGTTAETLQTGSSANVYKGATLVTMGGHSYLYAANFATGNVDVLKGDPGAPNLTGGFTDPTLPSGYHPFNVQVLGGNIFVAYALNTGSLDESDGPGLGVVDEFDANGNFVARVASTGGMLNAPWGLVMAPANFGAFSGDLLVGNFGDGTIDAFDPTTWAFVGQLTGQDGKPIVIDGLWGLMAGNGGNAGSASEILFSAGPNDESDGLVGALSFVPEPASMFLFGAAWVSRSDEDLGSSGGRRLGRPFCLARRLH